jgi:hypothetical protein
VTSRRTGVMVRRVLSTKKVTKKQVNPLLFSKITGKADSLKYYISSEKLPTKITYILMKSWALTTNL